MPDSHEFITSVNQLLTKLNESGELNTGLEIANRIMILLGSTETEPVDNIVDEHVMQLPNAERYDHWFQNHPWMGGERAAFEVLDAKETPIQAKFYWLKKRSRQFIAGGVHFTENWEDAPYTRNDSFKIGIDFFLAPDGKSLLVTLSNKGNLRIVELQQKLNNTQVEIFTKWRDATQVASVEALHTTLWDSFMLQTVNKEFYKGVANSFTELLQHLNDSGREEEASKLFASRLLGRLLFVWFLRKKSIIDESIGYFDSVSVSSTTYYRNSLERLFFNTLNVPIDDRDEFKNENQKRLLEVGDNEPQTKIFQTDSTTPYLNGGLFEPHENDWYKDTDLTFPEGYFTNLFEHFNQFNFTTDESTPEYEQVAIDPEMLGQVFESLLATQVDETGQQARKAKGAFYTPREIVSYMCKESLRNYLYGKVKDEDRYTKSVDLLLDRSDHEWAGAGSNSKRDAVPKEYRSIIVDALDTVTVLDPACGSGAFPMGMLQLLIKTYERLEGRFDPYKTKLQIVQNNIFGVDIEPMAIEIARLRAWLSLIVDEEESQKVAPLPNLDFKFVCANSLIPLDKEQGLFADSELHQKLKDIRIKYFNARVPSSKKKLQSEYNKLADSTQQTLMDDLRTKQLKSFDPFRNSQPAEFFDADQMFGLESGFDILIANPPYIKERDNKKTFEAISLSSTGQEYHQGKMDFWFYFLHIGIFLIKKEGIINFITSRYWLSSAGSRKLISHIKEDLSFIDLVDIGKLKVFNDVAGHHMIALYSKRKDRENFAYKILNNDISDISSTTNTKNIMIEELNNSKIYSDDGKIELSQDPVSYDGMSTLGEVSVISQGVVQNPDKVSSKTATKFGLVKGEGVFVISNEELKKLNLNDDEKVYIKPFYEESSIDKFRLKNDKEFKNLIYLTRDNCKSIEALPNLKAHLEKFKAIMDVRRETMKGTNKWYQMHWPRKQEYFDLPKIVIPGMFNSPKAAYVKEAAYFGLSSNIITGIQKEEDLFIILAILNSKFAYFWFTKHGKMRGAGVDIGVDKLRNLPIPELNTNESKELGLLSKEIFLGNLAGMNSLDMAVYKAYRFTAEEITSIEMTEVR